MFKSCIRGSAATLAIAAALVSAANPALAAQTWSLANGVGGTATATTMVAPWSAVWRSGANCNTGAPQPLTLQHTYGTAVGLLHAGLAVNQPHVGKTFGTSDFTHADGGVVPSGAINLHPGPGGECAIARFTVPASQPSGGAYTIATTFAGIYGNAQAGPGDGVRALVLVNGVPVGSPVMTSNPGGGAVNAAVTLNPLDTVDVAVGMNGNYQSDTTLVSVTISGPDSRGPADNGGGIPVLSCSNSAVNPAAADLSTGVANWTVSGPSGSGAAVSAGNVAWSAVPGAQWIGPAGAPQTAGTYTFQTRVRINPCPNGRPAQVSAAFRADNKATLSVGTATINQAGTPNYGFLPASLSNGSYTFPAGTSGVQTITITVNNIGGPTGLSAKIGVTR